MDKIDLKFFSILEEAKQEIDMINDKISFLEFCRDKGKEYEIRNITEIKKELILLREKCIKRLDDLCLKELKEIYNKKEIY